MAVPMALDSLFVASACTVSMPGHQQQRGQLDQPAAADDRVDPPGREGGQHEQDHRRRAERDQGGRGHRRRDAGGTRTDGSLDKQGSRDGGRATAGLGRGQPPTAPSFPTRRRRTRGGGASSAGRPPSGGRTGRAGQRVDVRRPVLVDVVRPERASCPSLTATPARGAVPAGRSMQISRSTGSVAKAWSTIARAASVASPRPQ